MAGTIVFGVKVPFTSHLGIEQIRVEAGEAELACELKPEHMNAFQVAHGGVILTLLDVAMGTAARETPEIGMITIEMKTTFMRPGTGRLTGKGRVMHRTRSLVFVEATIHDAQGQLCAHATGTYKAGKPPASAPKGATASD